MDRGFGKFSANHGDLEAGVAFLADVIANKDPGVDELDPPPGELDDHHSQLNDDLARINEPPDGLNPSVCYGKADLYQAGWRRGEGDEGFSKIASSFSDVCRWSILVTPAGPKLGRGRENTTMG